MIAAEWLKFRTVRGWIIGLVAAAAAIAVLGLIGGGGGTCFGNSCAQPTGPDGEAVTDNFYFVHQPLSGDGSISVRVSSLNITVPVPHSGMRPALVGWAKAGIILKASLRQGSAYAAIMLTPSHGVRMQDDFTGDIAGPLASARWLRLTRAGSVITGYESADGAGWIRVGAVRLPGLPATVQAGLFATSPQYSQTSLGVAQISGSPSQATATFEDLGLSWQSAAWTGTDVGATDGGGNGGGASGIVTGYHQSGGTYTLSGTGDIAPAVSGANGLGVTIAQTLIGTFIALIVMSVISAMFVTAEYRRGLIRVTLAACPRRGRVLAAKAVVTGGSAFIAGLVGAAIVVPLGQHALRSRGMYVAPVTMLTEIRVIAGTAAVLAICAVLATAIGALLRQGAAAVGVVVAVVVLPYLLAVAFPVLPLTVLDWLVRVTPAAGFAVQQTVVQYPQVDNVYAPAYGYFPLSAWAGFAVLCAWALAALALAAVALNRRDA